MKRRPAFSSVRRSFHPGSKPGVLERKSKAIMSHEPKKNEQAPEVKTERSGESLLESELEQAAAGKVTFNPPVQ